MRRRGGSSSTTRTRSRSWAESSTSDVAANEDQEGGPDRRHREQQADPHGLNDRRPIDRRAQEPLPGVELGAEQVGLQAAEPGQNADELEEQRDHQGANDGRGAVARNRRQEQ